MVPTMWRRSQQALPLPWQPASLGWASPLYSRNWPSSPRAVHPVYFAQHLFVQSLSARILIPASSRLEELFPIPERPCQGKLFLAASCQASDAPQNLSRSRSTQSSKCRSLDLLEIESGATRAVARATGSNLPVDPAKEAEEMIDETHCPGSLPMPQAPVLSERLYSRRFAHAISGDCPVVRCCRDGAGPDRRRRASQAAQRYSIPRARQARRSHSPRHASAARWRESREESAPDGQDEPPFQSAGSRPYSRSLQLRHPILSAALADLSPRRPRLSCSAPLHWTP